MLTHQELGQFLDEHFGDRLRQRGFVPHPRRPCQWYKVVKEEVLLGFITEPGVVSRDDFLAELAYYPLFMGEYLPYSKNSREYWFDLVDSLNLYCPSKIWFAEECYSDFVDKDEMKAHTEKLMRQGWVRSISAPLLPCYYRTTVYYMDCLLEEKVFPILDPIVDVRTCAEQRVQQIKKLWAERKDDPFTPKSMHDLGFQKRYLYECVYLDRIDECNWFQDVIIPKEIEKSATAEQTIKESYPEVEITESFEQSVQDSIAYFTQLQEKLSEKGYVTLKRELEEARAATYQSVKKKLKLK